MKPATPLFSNYGRTPFREMPGKGRMSLYCWIKQSPRPAAA